jgi:hypothetical protein
MQDKLWVVYERPRWMPGFMRSGGFDAKGHENVGNYLCSIGSLEVFRTLDMTVRAVRDPELDAGHNYTMVMRTNDDRILKLTDGDVVPTPFEMCALYQMAHLLWDRYWIPDDRRPEREAAEEAAAARHAERRTETT